VVKHIKIFEELNSSEINYFEELKNYGFNIEYKLDTKGFLYACRLTMPWHAVDLLDDKAKMNAVVSEYLFDLILHKGRDTIYNDKGFKGITGFQSREWGNSRNIDSEVKHVHDWLIWQIKYMEANHSIRVLKLHPDEFETRRIDKDTSGQINRIW